MQFSIISAKEAPPEPKAMTTTKQFSLDLLSNLKKGQVARVEAEEGETLMGLTMSIKRAATELGKSILAYRVDEFLYVKLTPPTE